MDYSKEGWYAPPVGKGGEMVSFKDYAKRRGYNQAALGRMERREYLDLQDSHLIDTNPLFEWLAGKVRKNGNGWHVCTLCQYPPMEQITEVKAHFEITHTELLPEGGENGCMPNAT